jgi:hypothetical protein
LPATGVASLHRARAGGHCLPIECFDTPSAPPLRFNGRRFWKPHPLQSARIGLRTGAFWALGRHKSVGRSAGQASAHYDAAGRTSGPGNRRTGWPESGGLKTGVAEDVGCGPFGVRFRRCGGKLRSYKIGLCRMMHGALQAPYEAISIDAIDDAEATKRGKEWAASLDIQDDTWLQVLIDGRSIASIRLR